MAEKFIKLKQEYFKILDMGLIPTDLLVLSIIDSLSQKRGYCSATNQYIAEMCHLSTRTIIRSLENLENFDIIQKENFMTKGSKSSNKRDIKIVKNFL